MVDLIYVPGADSHQLRIKIFPLSLADDAKEWWISKGDGKITTWEELVETFFCRFYPESYDGEDKINNEWKESKYENQSNTATNSFFKAYDVRDIKKENGQGQIKRKDNDKDNKRPHKKICTTKKFEAMKYSLGPNEEYLAIRRMYNSSQNSCDFTTVTIIGESEERGTNKGIIRNCYDREDGETTPRFEA
ncbi:hypothetical protein Tco_1404112 [Tanacetum coccineum]